MKPGNIAVDWYNGKDKDFGEVVLIEEDKTVKLTNIRVRRVNGEIVFGGTVRKTNRWNISLDLKEENIQVLA